MPHDLSRLMTPTSLVVIGGGVWGRSVIEQCRKIGFEGELFVVHPKADDIEGITPFRSVLDLPYAPDAAFVGVNRHASIEVLKALSDFGVGGAVCFASGFLEADAEDAQAAALQDELIQAAGDMPFIGPNCYGFINYLDRFCIWPDQHGGCPVSSGVAIVTQSSNIMINLTMHQRGLPIGYAFTAGNQAQTSVSALGCAALSDPRITALGLHIEGIGDLAEFEQLATYARQKGKAIVAVKVGRSALAQQAAISHTASLAGSDAGADALFRRLGIGRANSLSEMIELLKIMHISGPLSGNAVASMSCSGGEASLMADLAYLRPGHIRYPELTPHQIKGLKDALGDRVALANPLDYHTYVWGDIPAMADAFTAMISGPVDIGVIIVDFPRADRCSPNAWFCVIEAAAIAKDRTGKPVALLSSLVENMSETQAEHLMQRGLIPLCGMEEGLAAVGAASRLGQKSHEAPVWHVPHTTDESMLDEASSKKLLASFGVDVPNGVVVDLNNMPASLPFEFPVVLKAMGIAHKSEAGGVVVGLKDEDSLRKAMTEMGYSHYLVEEMIQDPIVEILIGVIADPVHGYTLTLAAGGVLTELLVDASSLILPVTDADIRKALAQLKIAPIFEGYRGMPAADITALSDAVLAVQSCIKSYIDTEAGADSLIEIEINPLLVTKSRAVAVDALIRKGVKADV